MKQLEQASKWLVTGFLAVLINHGTTLNGETKFDFSGAHFLNVNVTKVTYAPTTSEIFLLAQPTQY
ncbi:Uncharacterised protein [Serratia fonticola]|uniref:hypothetical protein n=1 Tax=Serratia fonticola TaxID=47917 RepID=UPI00217C1BAE|nr:hypothetical protein [Serratia fonticola]CAI1869898.1 Uncharacterised protein [Serratia fonticola]